MSNIHEVILELRNQDRKQCNVGDNCEFQIIFFKHNRFCLEENIFVLWQLQLPIQTQMQKSIILNVQLEDAFLGRCRYWLCCFNYLFLVSSRKRLRNIRFSLNYILYIRKCKGLNVKFVQNVHHTLIKFVSKIT